MSHRFTDRLERHRHAAAVALTAALLAAIGAQRIELAGLRRAPDGAEPPVQIDLVTLPEPPSPPPVPTPPAPVPLRPQPPQPAPVDARPQPLPREPAAVTPQPAPAAEPAPVEPRPVPRPAAEPAPRAIEPPRAAEPPKPSTASIENEYVALVRALLNASKRYPSGREASLQRPEGRTRVWFVLTRSGALADSGILDSSSSLILDNAALATIRRVSYPPFPAEAWPGSEQHKFTAELDFKPPS